MTVTEAREADRFVAVVHRQGRFGWKWLIEVHDTTTADLFHPGGQVVARYSARGEREHAADVARRRVDELYVRSAGESFRVHPSAWKPAYPPTARSGVSTGPSCQHLCRDAERRRRTAARAITALRAREHAQGVPR